MSSLARDLRKALSAVAEPERAKPMQAYMKSQMPYLGVPTPARRTVCRALFAGVDLPTAPAWRRSVLGLWRDARYREERYAAIDLTEIRRFDGFQDMATREVRRYVRHHEGTLSALSRREALRNVGS